MGAVQARPALPFSVINRPGLPGYDSGLQKHHLLPKQLLKLDCFISMLEQLGRKRVGFDDFRKNGLLLPSRSSAAVRFGLPLHRGPHRQYNEMVIERVGQIESSWSVQRLKTPDLSVEDALMRLNLLQKALRRRLLDPTLRRLKLNRCDPLGMNLDFADLDAMADALWGETDVVQLNLSPSSRFASRY